MPPRPTNLGAPESLVGTTVRDIVVMIALWHLWPRNDAVPFFLIGGVEALRAFTVEEFHWLKRSDPRQPSEAVGRLSLLGIAASWIVVGAIRR